uniref:Uncharacterized protein n=1 Tax=Cyanothece sp. (strain PCC 7425 / ATCC 29141) TaxID=395961 RepID=B8HUC0_CYAP4
MNLIELLANIKKRPSMYLGRKSLSHLRTFLDGYGLARRQLGIPISIEEKSFEQFQKWIEHRFNQPATQSWDRIILFYAEDDSIALTRFFELFDEFWQQYSNEVKSKKPDGVEVMYGRYGQQINESISHG